MEDNIYKTLCAEEVRICNSPAKCCSDFDNDCAQVKNHAACFVGGQKFNPLKLEVIETDVADGYCPFVIGMISHKVKNT